MPTAKKPDTLKKSVKTTGPKTAVKAVGDIAAPPPLSLVKGRKFGLDVEVEKGKPPLQCDFVAGSPGKFDVGGGYLMMSGELQLANGQTAYAVLEISTQDGGEHCGTGIMLPAYNGRPQTIVFQSDKNFLSQLKRFGITKDDIFPYKYRYYDRLDRDHHVGEDGWSR